MELFFLFVKMDISLMSSFQELSYFWYRWQKAAKRGREREITEASDPPMAYRNQPSQSDSESWAKSVCPHVSTS